MSAPPLWSWHGKVVCPFAPGLSQGQAELMFCRGALRNVWRSPSFGSGHESELLKGKRISNGLVSDGEGGSLKAGGETQHCGLSPTTGCCCFLLMGNALSRISLLHHG